MYGLIFKNRWFAAAWALIMLASIASFFSDGGGQEKLQSVAADFKAQSEELQKSDSGHSFVIDEEELDGNGFTTDKQLMLEARDAETEEVPVATPSE